MKDFFLVGLTLLIIGVGGLVFMGFQGKAFSFTSFFGDVESFEKTASFNSSDITRIDLDVSSDDVQLHRSETNEITVRYYGESNNHEKAVESFYAEQQGDTLQIGTKSTVNFGISYRDVNIEISLPEKQWEEISLSSSSGDIKAVNLEADNLAVKLSSGDVRFDDIVASQIGVKTSSGSFEGDHIKGELTVQTSSGDVELFRQELDHNVSIKSSSGDVSIQASEKPSNLFVQFDSSSGEADIAFPMKFSSMDESHIKGSVGEGKYEIKVNTSSGDFEFNQ
ncbi:DUF4097 family beta strand repeat-containing protein [Pontibacillus marinus]|uniref:DUF4097 domain-containing protein n=1 Tax=Pontibacillus marinus BH030004 = DSM 16465 TaxID=1385511 RepID=A0A0A5FTE5_9BACI|nr:DUF4097 family beta strand repeat-containing protein [Pontibacillus marinus]KGX84011.1 hypothetical protein N783_19475 [Pontibacillus marinus BH030004 = DSM 16465]